MSNKTKTTIMKKDAKPTLTPKLRFLEFRDKPGWEETKLKDVLMEHRMRSGGKSEVHSVSVHKGVINQIEHLGRSFAAADTSNYNLAQPYDVIYTKSPTGDFPFGVVKHNHNTYDVIVSPLYGVFSPTNKYLGYIFDAYFESPIRASNYLAPITQKGAKNTLQISNETFLSGGIYLPREEGEQQKIADCLKSLDKIIASQVRQLGALKTHKKGLMQQLFPREGETQPCLRFPEFQDAGEWEQKKLSNVVHLVSGMHLSPEQYSKEEGEIPYFTGPSDYTNNDQRITKWTKELASLAEENDTLITVKGSGVGELWYLTLPSVAMGRQLMAIRAKGSSSRFVYQFLLTKKARFEDLGAGNLIPGLSRGDILDLKVPFPKVLEQQKIADCLTSLDEVIVAQTQKLDGLNTHKKGLMQQLFLSPAEVEA